MTDSLVLTVRTGIGTVHRLAGTDFDVPDFTDEVEDISRKPQQHAGWESIRYKGKRYQLHGGIRTPFFISLTNPIKGKGDNR